MLAEMLPYLLLVGIIVLGAVAAAVVALIPGLHIYSVAPLVLLVIARTRDLATGEQLAMFVFGLVVGYAMVNTVPAIFLAAPDDSLVLAVQPAQRFLHAGRGFEAAALAGVGSLGGMAVLLALAPAAHLIFPPLLSLIQPHLHWILMALILYMLMSEWPVSSGRGTAWQRLREAWSPLLAGLITFALSGLLGIVLLHRKLAPVDVAYQNLLPAFVGFFAIPAVLHNLTAGRRPPQQHIARTLDLTPALIAQGVGAGAFGGLFAAFFPMVTGGVGGLLAGQAIAQRDDRVFIISQGAAKLLYHVGAFLLFFTPDLHRTRGGIASLVATVHVTYSPAAYYVAVAGLALAGAITFSLLLAFAGVAARLVVRLGPRQVAGGTLVVLLVVVIGLTGPGGLLIAAVTASIGLIPILWRTERAHCLAVVLVPVTLNLAGLGRIVAGWLGLA